MADQEEDDLLHVAEEEVERGSPPNLDLDGIYGDQSESGSEGMAQVAESGNLYRVDHTMGDIRLTAKKLSSIVQDENFDGARAINLLQQKNTIDYSDNMAKVRRERFRMIPSFYLDMFCVMGKVLRPITKVAGFFDCVEFGFGRWHAPYASKHAAKLLDFSLKGRTFRLGSGPDRLCWYVVMHPTDTRGASVVTSEAPSGNSRAGRTGRTALERHHAEALHAYILEIFLDARLVGEGVEASWTLGSRNTRQMSCRAWRAFQELFMEGWAQFREDMGMVDEFWRYNKPAFHAYDHGANIPIKISQDFAREVAREEPMRAYESHSVRASSPYDVPSSDPVMPPDDGVEYGDEDDDETAIASQIENESAEWSGIGSDDLDWRGGTEAGEPRLGGEDARRLLGGELGDLYDSLVQRYELAGIDQMAFALAVNLNCWKPERGFNPDEGYQPGEKGEPWAMLAARDYLAAEFGATSGLTFFPMAFHPRFGNFSASEPPRFLQNLIAVLCDNARIRSGGMEVLRFGHFQGYSNVKRTIRPEPNALLATQAIATGGLGLPPVDARAADIKVERTRQGLMGGLKRDSTRPYKREGDRVRDAMTGKEVAFRMEQVYCVRTSSLGEEQGGFSAVINPILQLIRLFLMERGSYERLLRAFRFGDFPGILGTYARLFDCAIGEMEQRHAAAGEDGLGLAHTEALALIDRLGNYCFTGDPRVLPTRILAPLGTVPMLKRGAWPYFDPYVLDVRDQVGRVDVANWAKDDTETLLLLHSATLRFYYGASVTAARQSRIHYELLRRDIPATFDSAVTFVVNILNRFWRQQTVDFLVLQLRRGLNQKARDAGVAEAIQTLRYGMKAWQESDTPFDETALPLLEAGKNILAAEINERSREDLARDLYNACMEKGDPNARLAYSAKGSTWFPMLQGGIQQNRERSDPLSPSDWIQAIALATKSAHIVWMPSAHRKRLSSRHLIRLVGDGECSLYSLSGRGSLSLKRQALRAIRGPEYKRRMRQLRMNFGCEIPFRQVPVKIQRGLRKLYTATKDRLLQGHYQMAEHLLGASLGSSEGELLFMLALTVTAPAEELYVDDKKVLHVRGRSHKDTDLVAAALATRMLWFLYPDFFPYKNSGSMMGKQKMAEKLWHHGVTNSWLQLLGWVRAWKETGRHTARTTELTLNDTDKLEEEYKTLKALLPNAEQFIARVLRSDDRVWLERCSTIIV